MRPVALLRVLLPLFMLAVVLPAHAQFGDSPTSGSDSKLDFGLNSEAFLYNAEFAHPLKVGYTLPGWTLVPFVAYGPWTPITFGIGWRHTQMIGRREPWQTNPLITLAAYPLEGLSITLGSLPEPEKHSLPDFLYSRQRGILNRPEMGARIAYEPLLKFYFAEVWLDWEEFIWRGAKKNEKFFLGAQLGRKSIVNLQGRLFFFAHHSGGQIDDTKLPVITSINTGGELGYTIEVGPSLLSAGTYAAVSRDGDKTHPFYGRTGYASRTYFSAVFRGFNCEVAYFHGYRFYTLRGEELYASYSDWSEGRSLARRQIVTGRLGFSLKTLDHLTFRASTDLFYDIPLRRVDWAFTLLARMNIDTSW